MLFYYLSLFSEYILDKIIKTADSRAVYTHESEVDLCPLGYYRAYSCGMAHVIYTMSTMVEFESDDENIGHLARHGITSDECDQML